MRQCRVSLGVEQTTDNTELFEIYFSVRSVFSVVKNSQNRTDYLGAPGCWRENLRVSGSDLKIRHHTVFQRINVFGFFADNGNTAVVDRYD